MCLYIDRLNPLSASNAHSFFYPLYLSFKKGRLKQKSAINLPDERIPEIKNYIPCQLTKYTTKFHKIFRDVGGRYKNVPKNISHKQFK